MSQDTADATTRTELELNMAEEWKPWILPNICYFCGNKPDGPMLVIAESMAHVDCVIRKLNELLDPDYDGKGEPEQIIGWLRER